MNPGSITDEQMASNNWVIHGNHTKTGKPLLSSDPHLSNGLPSNWYLMELNYKGHHVAGATYPGIPLVMIGKTENFAWGITAVLADVSDLYREKLNDDRTSYLLDGNWKPLTIIEEEIKVKGQDMPLKLKIRLSHRGPIVD